MKKFKRVLSLLMMSAMLILPTALPVQADEVADNDIKVAVVSNGEVSVYATAFSGRGRINTNGVYLRSGAGTNTTKLEWMAVKEEVIIDKIGDKTDSSGNSWYHVKRVDTGTIGYVMSKYVTVLY